MLSKNWRLPRKNGFLLAVYKGEFIFILGAKTSQIACPTFSKKSIYVLQRTEKEVNNKQRRR